MPNGRAWAAARTVVGMQPVAAPVARMGPPPLLAAVLTAAAAQHASDVHLRPGKPVWVRCGGDFQEWTEEAASEDDVAVTKEWIGPEGTVRTVAAAGSRWRGLSFRAGAVLRRIPAEPPPFKMLGLPKVVQDFTRFPEGLVVVAGSTGSGKSSTIASLLAEMATMRRCHILTIEEPLEYVIPDGRSLVTQQEVPKDLHEQALEEAHRADAEVVMLGECRLPTHFELCLTLAASGQLVFTTVHAGNALECCERIIAMTGDSGHSMMAATLRAVLTQRLIASSTNTKKRYCATEVMLVEGGIHAAIRPGGNLAMLRPRIEDTQYSLHRSLAELVRDNKITEAAAAAEASDPSALKKLIAARVVPGHGTTRARP